MARENQGLQIALIVFVMLTIILGVTTFIFYGQYNEAQTKATTAEKSAADQRAAASAIAGECMELKREIGVAETEKLEDYSAQFKQTMAEFGGNFPEENRFYRPLLGYLAQAIQDKVNENALLKAEVQKLKDEYEIREAAKDTQIQQLQAALKKAEQDLAAQIAKFDTDRTRFTKDQGDLQTQLQAARKKAADDLASLQVNVDETQQKNQLLTTRNRQMTDRLKGLVEETFEVADGEIRFVNQRNGTAWINLGRADSLARQTTFAVYPMDTTNLAKGVKKGSIEVTQILGEHLAEVRVLEDEISDPIMPGDKIHTPVWTPGERKRFALTGFMDIDDDGKSDLQTIRNLITMHGGVIDCETDDTGKRRGEMTISTRYLVLGETLDARGGEEMVAASTAMIREAEQLGIQKIPLRDLLQRMGWKNQTPVVQFGRGANPENFRARAPEGGPKVSSGTVSGLFQPRQAPPRRGDRSGGAY
ncbi:MAG: hypothetical protein JXB62_12185 [Pirellulales bacterium]|nr:hypothetical protein [Pirellulales bacterium]